ncbi:hypothetical protein [Borrelia sp. P9F1]|uniref:hypothetical protein n=1 Tax=Borrelia sp. P9F1 TaxID=3058374 RepID=UPI002648DBC9|nr:hypothetical protein [Borrelia sp. P9F1]WKC58508.1 hypothetical protein QYZ68_04835 [Borrelia sp. P9F1]
MLDIFLTLYFYNLSKIANELVLIHKGNKKGNKKTKPGRRNGDKISQHSNSTD